MQTNAWPLALCCAGFLALAPAAAQDAPASAGRSEPRFEIGAEIRLRAETRDGVGENAAREDGFGLSRLQLNLTVRPSKDLRFFVQAQDARVVGLARGRSARPFRNALDFRQAYVGFGRVDGPVTLSVGRKEMDFLDGRLLGRRGWSNTSPTWDGASLDLRRGEDSVSLVAVSQVDVLDGFDLPSRTRFVVGAFGTIQSGLRGQKIEPFFLTTRRPAEFASNLGGMLRTVGSRFTGILAQSWDYQVILAAQWGVEENRTHQAWMGVWGIGRTIEAAPARPRLGLEWSYASGDRDPEDGRCGTFDTLFPSPHGRYGEQDITANRNIRILMAGVDLHPRKSLRVDVDFLDMRLASLQDGLYHINSRRRIAPPARGATSGFVGSELDLVVRYQASPKLEFRFGVSRFFAGEFVIRNLPDGGSQTFLNTGLTLKL